LVPRALSVRVRGAYIHFRGAQRVVGVFCPEMRNADERIYGIVAKMNETAPLQMFMSRFAGEPFIERVLYADQA
jgi:hypothetical protein